MYSASAQHSMYMTDILQYISSQLLEVYGTAVCRWNSRCFRNYCWDL